MNWNELLELYKNRKYFTSKLTLFLVAIATISAITTYITITGSDNPLGENSIWTNFLIIIDFAIFLSLVTLIIRKIQNLRLKKDSEQGFRLQNRILLMFSFVASIPTIIVAIFSTLFFHYGIESWFDKKVSTALDESVVVAESYLKEHREVLGVKAKSMALEIDNSIIHYNLTSNLPLFVEILTSLAELNSISEAVIFHNQKPFISTRFGLSLTFERINRDIYERAAKGETVVFDSGNEKIRAIAMLKNIPNSYIVIGKLLDSNIINHIHHSQGAADQYKNLKVNISNAQIKFSIIFFAVSIMLLLAAIWLGITFAGYIVKPIRKLVYATERIKSGDLQVQVEEGSSNDEITILTKAFNLMTKQIDVQRTKLVDAYQEIDEKRKFSEAVLSGVSSGVIALSKSKKITLINSFALDLLNLKESDVLNKTITKILPEIAELFENISSFSGYKSVSGQINAKAYGKRLTLLVRITVEKDKKLTSGYIITFDNMTELLNAQRNAAWSDVARRIAHEVKNPLTPIQLGAERIIKKYKNDVKDAETLEKYTNTIIRHAGDIRKIIEEFSNFARMPAPIPTKLNICHILKDAIFSSEYLSSQIKYEVNFDAEEIFVNCDQTQLNQVFINILKNACESISATPNYAQGLGVIIVNAQHDKNTVTVEIVDNGLGFDKDSLDRITEPYYTTRTKGTGLGLAIVRKIVDDHHGELALFNDEQNRAHVKITLPLYKIDKGL